MKSEIKEGRVGKMSYEKLFEKGKIGKITMMFEMTERTDYDD